jgi:hypothetical protein
MERTKMRTLQEFDHDVDTSTGEFTEPRPSVSRAARTNEGILIFGRYVKSALNASAAEKAPIRAVLIRMLRNAPTPDLYIGELLSITTSAKNPDRLEFAIDVLSHTGDLIRIYAWNYLVTDIRQWHHLHSDRAYEPNDDYWYVLLRAVARCTADAEVRFRIISMCRTSRAVSQ